MPKSSLESEWSLLQNQFDSYEKYSLVIKLISVGVLTYAFTSGVVGVFVVCLLLVLWMQDAIWKTFQGRIETRLLQVEKSLAATGNSDVTAFQFNTQFLQHRSGITGLIVEYVKQALRPTVAYPHVVLVLMGIIEALVH